MAVFAEKNYSFVLRRSIRVTRPIHIPYARKRCDVSSHQGVTKGHSEMRQNLPPRWDKRSHLPVTFLRTIKKRISLFIIPWIGMIQV